MSAGSERYARLKALLLGARDQPASERERWVRAHADDAGLADEVIELLAHEHAPHALLDEGVVPVPADLARPGRIGPYHIEAVLGEGGMGVVYRARQEVPIRRVVALKLIRWGMHHETVVRRFEQERRTLALMDHPHIATVLDAGTDEHGHPWFVMPLVEGLPLLEFCDSERLDVDQRLRLFEEICRAVHHAHGRGVLHRDLKPGNVLVRRVSGRPVPVIIDFGIAKALQEDDEFTMLLTREGQRVGTPAYMSPEQLAGREEQVDARSDVYSLGIILYELLAGRHPFRDAEGKLSDSTAIAPRPPSTAITDLDTSELAERRSMSARELRRALKGDVDTICLMAVRSEPERRYASAAHLADDLRRMREGHPVDARPDSWRYRTGKFVRRHPAATALSGAALVAIVAGAAGLSWHARQLGFERDRALVAEARALRELETSRAVTGFFGELFELARPDVGGDPNLGALAMLDQADERVPETLAGQPWLQAEIYRAVGDLNISLSRLDASRQLLELALAANDSISGRDQSEIDHQRAQILVDYGTVVHDLGDYARAVGLLRESLALFERSTMTDSTEVAVALNLLATNLQADGQLEAALAPTERALRLSEQYGPPDDPEVAWGWQLLGYINYQLGNLEAARGQFERAVELGRRIFEGDHYDMAQHLNNLGGYWVTMGQPDRAEPFLIENLEMCQRMFSTEPNAVLSRAWTQLARVHTERGQHDRALELLEEAWTVSVASLGTDHPRHLLFELDLAQARQHAGDPDSAIALGRAATAAILAQLPPDHRTAMRARFGLAELLVLRGEYAAALEQLALYAPWIEERHPPGHPDRCAYEACLGEARFGVGDRDAGIALVRSAYDGSMANFGPSSTRTRAVGSLLARIEGEAR